MRSLFDRWSVVRRRASVYWGFVTGYIGANLQGALEYRLSFASQVAAMLINDIIWLVFWLAYFTSFPVVGGWGRNEIVTMWAILGASFGVAATLCGGASQIAGMVMRGELDFYLALPKPTLLHILISRMDLTAPGDVLFGIIVYALLVGPAPVQIGLFALFTLTGAIIFVAFTVITQSLAFWLGQRRRAGATVRQRHAQLFHLPHRDLSRHGQTGPVHDHPRRIRVVHAGTTLALVLMVDDGRSARVYRRQSARSNRGVPSRAAALRIGQPGGCTRLTFPTPGPYMIARCYSPTAFTRGVRGAMRA